MFWWVQHYLQGEVLTDSFLQDSYHTFMQASHIHWHLQAVWWSGQVHDIDEFIPHWRKNCITVHCPACPEPEWNINLEVLKNALESKKWVCTLKMRPLAWLLCRHKYTLFLDCDGTFNVPHINKPDDPNEESLNAGRAFIVEEHEYQRYLSHVENDPPDVSAQWWSHIHSN